MWPTAMRVSMGSEWWKPSRWEHLDLGVRGRGVCGTWGEERKGSHHEETEGEDIWKHYTAHTVIIFSHAHLMFYAASLAQGESTLGPSCWIGFDR